MKITFKKKWNEREQKNNLFEIEMFKTFKDQRPLLITSRRGPLLYCLRIFFDVYNIQRALFWPNHLWN